MHCVRRWVPLVLLLACRLAVAQSAKPTDSVRSSAMKMPDGTVVFITKNPGDADPKIDGVLLSAAEYQALVEQTEKVKRARDGAKPQPPGKVELRARIEPRGDRTVAAVTALFTYRTVSPKTVVTLGCQRATATRAKGSDGKTPVLTAGDDGFAVLAENPGDHTLTLDLEAAVTARGPKGEIGFEFGLPRAAITTFALDKPPVDVKAVSVGTRAAEPFAAVKHAPAAIPTMAFALGPTDTLELLWEPRAAADAAELTADGDVVIRVGESQVETVAKLKLRGPTREWPLTLPPNAEVTVERAGKAASPLTTPAVVEKPADPQKPVWVVRTPPDPDGWLVTVTARTLRPKAGDPKARGPYPIGPFHLPNVRHTGRVRVYAPPSVRVGFRPSADMRRLDLPAPADDDLVAVFSYSSPAVGRGWGEFDVRPLANVPRVRPHHKLTLTANGWRLESTVRVTPPPRGEVEQMTVELPPGWQGWEFGPDDQVESDTDTTDPSGKRTITLKFVTPQKAAADLRVLATHPLPAAGRQATLPFPRFLQADERDTQVEVAGGDGWTVTATGSGWDRGPAAGVAVPLRGAGRDAAGEFDRGVSLLDVNWRPFRPDLACDIRTDVTVQDRQLAVQQSFRFRLTDGDTRPLRLAVQGEPVGLRWTPRLEPAGPNEWVYRLPPDVGKEVTLVAQYAVKTPKADDADPVPVPLIHPTTATSADAVVRVWGGGGRRAAGFIGDWRELAPELNPDADSLPWFTLGSSALAPPVLALTDWSAAAPIVVERAVVQATIADDGARVRGRYLLRHWEGSHVDFDLPPSTAVEASVDGKRVDPVLLAGGARVMVPELKPGRGMVTVEVRVQLPAANSRFTGRLLTPPCPRQANYRAPVRWQVFGGPADVLAALGGAQAEWRWGWKGYGFGPMPVESPADVENWFRAAGVESGEPVRPVVDGDTILVRQPTPWPLRVVVAPRPVAVLAVSALTFAVVYGFVRLAGRRTGLLFVLLSAAAAAAVVWMPYLTVSVVAAGQPGIALAAAVLLGRTTWLRYHRRAARPATFSATPLAPPSTPSGDGVPRPNGTTSSSPSDSVRVLGS